MVNSILVVCTGNICRSPIGERLLRQQMPGFTVASAGVSGLVGHAADARAQEVAALHGVSLEGHVAQKLTPQLMREYDLILAMEPEHLNHISAMAPEIRGRSLLFGQWLQTRAIPDPYRKSHEAYEYVFDLLGRASQEWAQRLSH
ncbi:protein tyrosine phosphatase [Lelliottia sp. V106_10]|uniref:protein-tyrosine-phosphatase n=2 Tax=Lelliottia wanjuensis TaxID=3050585 RepID=A0AAP4D2K5_9ENTR|nr:MULTISPECIES: protein tyrosine phosphatase [unclassified Lelliottia]MDK9549108.1 protein tyrosine phosphatase [Lelliottia sp. V89_5]MDI3362646.1 protein tyrosine phosphatase [Lelliottia sp. V89_13]MDK9357052.1 protein tyrosine phosphatase [Lelliottia sp. V106_16]MDK9362372.1 protein tyrosine phosphatase [Lelliottia sp. V106_12]MDK9372276.1 protein tyrosine phosphatase [Lelliottia sp. V106_10]